MVWPLLVIAVAAVAGRLRRPLTRVLGPAALAVAITSYVLMAVLYRPGDVSRVYFGTETRIGAIALGAVLATVLRRWGGPRTCGGRAVLQGAGVVALGGLAVAWLLVAGTSPWLYRGGFVLLGVAVVVVIGAVVQPESRLARAVSWAPLRGLGLISYGLYLWHWVVIATLTKQRTGLSGLTLDAVQLGVSLAAALVSYWCLEQPIRRRRWVPASQAAVPVAVGAYTAVFGLVVASTLVPPPALGGLAAALQGRAAAVAAPPARQGGGEACGPGCAAGQAAAPLAVAAPAVATPTTVCRLRPPSRHRPPSRPSRRPRWACSAIRRPS